MARVATVEVVGTAFWVEAEEQRVRVRVERGAVLVRGERVPERVQRLSAGEEIEIRKESAVPAAGSASGGRPAAAAPRAPWRELAGRGAFKDAYEQLGAGGIAAASAARRVLRLLTE